ncbi:transglutaminase family protein [Fulvivirga lutea]|uniref:Transglutaminase family protein n=1 Tax=Fulvivirga lutea TaxID=2810512 RepID=A0A974WGH5_9BACT|nr:transglutaminase family protein [Fulvivirga lutea]QSE96647.1 transglutaminase family protein [Fulvivirga lutea]
MKLKIKHTTSYLYQDKVFPEPHHLYFYPQNRSYLTVLDHTIEIAPKPDGRAIRLDVENNSYEQCWFNNLTDQLTVNVLMTLEVSELNQFNFLVEEKSKTNHTSAIKLYLEHQLLLNEELVSWLEDVENNNPVQFVGALCHKIHKKWDHTTSYSPDLLDPNSCFNSDAASCRDLAWMMIQMLRHKGYPARFVSGYSYNPEITGHELHAWVEVWVAGAGWIGIDPSSGLFITELYIPLATSYHPVNTLPVQGSFRGNGTSELQTKVDIDLID